MCKIQRKMQKNSEKCAKFREICKIHRNVQNYEKCAEFRETCKIQRNVQNLEKCAEFREMCKIQRNVQNSEKYARFREMCRIQRNVQNSEKHAKLRDMCKIQKLLDKFTNFKEMWYFWSKVWLFLTNVRGDFGDGKKKLGKDRLNLWVSKSFQ